MLFMRCSYGIPYGEEYEYELSAAIPNNFVPSYIEDCHLTQLEAGLYACLSTAAYGAMTGVLDRLYQWLDVSPEYQADHGRCWFTQYEPAEGSPVHSSRVHCFVPVVQKNSIQEVCK
ncbi:DNA gyrase inhibitor GyrI [Paenibacillus castaneae]|uniref:hypothetical protein n=1 Tax=Paenibacillus castaneae TaxID=474957 RepID=UPI0011AEF50E|nr:hypothetical protein [Paenibacillus castaneae]NIK78833.1 DNA gyrase inhibitor GyrI [Paenibacillus castaneae]